MRISEVCRSERRTPSAAINPMSPSAPIWPESIEKFSAECQADSGWQGGQQTAVAASLQSASRGAGGCGDVTHNPYVENPTLDQGPRGFDASVTTR